MNLEIESELRTLKPLILERFRVKRLGYFGSFAAGTQGPESDIDIIVEFAVTPGWEFFDLQELLEDRLQRRIDLVSINALKMQLRDSILSRVRFV